MEYDNSSPGGYGSLRSGFVDEEIGPNNKQSIRAKERNRTQVILATLFFSILVVCLASSSKYFNTKVKILHNFNVIESSAVDEDLSAYISPYIEAAACSSYEAHNELVQCCADPSHPVLGGVDVVAISRMSPGSNPVWGDKEFQSFIVTEHGSYVFYFQSESNKEVFDSDPWKFCPLYGGFAADKLATDQFNSLEAISSLGAFSNIVSWVVYGNQLMFTSGEYQFSSYLKKKIAKKAQKNWAALFPDNDAIFNTQCLTIIREVEISDEDLEENLIDKETTDEGEDDVTDPEFNFFPTIDGKPDIIGNSVEKVPYIGINSIQASRDHKEAFSGKQDNLEVSSDDKQEKIVASTVDDHQEAKESADITNSQTFDKNTDAKDVSSAMLSVASTSATLSNAADNEQMERAVDQNPLPPTHSSSSLDDIENFLSGLELLAVVKNQQNKVNSDSQNEGHLNKNELASTELAEVEVDTDPSSRVIDKDEASDPEIAGKVHEADSFAENEKTQMPFQQPSMSMYSYVSEYSYSYEPSVPSADAKGVAHGNEYASAISISDDVVSSTSVDEMQEVSEFSETEVTADFKDEIMPDVLVRNDEDGNLEITVGNPLGGLSGKPHVEIGMDPDGNIIVVVKKVNSIMKIDGDVQAMYTPRTLAPTDSPTYAPTSSPTASPTLSPTEAPTMHPTNLPTSSPSLSPSSSPSVAPSLMPTLVPTSMPTLLPTRMPTASPTEMPTATPKDPESFGWISPDIIQKLVEEKEERLKEEKAVVTEDSEEDATKDEVAAGMGEDVKDNILSIDNGEVHSGDELYVKKDFINNLVQNILDAAPDKNADDIEESTGSEVNTSDLNLDNGGDQLETDYNEKFEQEEVSEEAAEQATKEAEDQAKRDAKEAEDLAKKEAKEAVRAQKEAEKAERDSEKMAAKQAESEPTVTEQVPTVPLFQKGAIKIDDDGIPVAAIDLVGGNPFPQTEVEVVKGRTIVDLPKNRMIPKEKDKPEGSGSGGGGNGGGNGAGANGDREKEEKDDGIPIAGIASKSTEDEGTLGDIGLANIPVAGTTSDLDSGLGGFAGLGDIPVAGQTNTDGLVGFQGLGDIPIAGQVNSAATEEGYNGLKGIPNVGDSGSMAGLVGLGDIPIAGREGSTSSGENSGDVSTNEELSKDEAASGSLIGLASLANIPVANTGN